jgi:glycerophosphoryl diester phosphodiesterase
MGFGGVEFDVMLSFDKVPLLIHDETLERTTNGSGAVSATPYAKITGLDAGGWFAPEYRGERAPTFDEAGRLCIELGLWANVEIKPAEGYEHETASIASRWRATSRRDSSVDTSATASSTVGAKRPSRSPACRCTAISST